nr:hypothetical protein [Candidatus Freyarchaeota archaeon]
MAREIDLEASASIISIASKYIIISVVLVALGAVAGVFAILTYLVYGTSAFASNIVVFLGLFVGLAFIAIGGFLTLWGLYWMRSEGRRLRKRFEKK